MMFPQPTKTSTALAATAALATYSRAYPKRKGAQTDTYRLAYFAFAGVALAGVVSLYRQGDLALGDGADGYAGPAKKIGRLEKQLARLEKRLAKKEAKGRSRATARIQRKIDKLVAKLNALQGEAASEGIPGFPGTPAPGMMPEYEMGPQGGGMPSWALPAAISGGVLLVVVAMASRD